VAVVALLSGVLLVAPAAALGARLVGGTQQAAIRHAFDATAAHRHQLIASIRVSSVDPAWAVVRSIRPQPGGRTSSGARPLRLLSAYYHRVGGAERPGSPPGAVRTDLTRPFRVAVVFTGSGSEAVAYTQAYRSDCAGQGGFTESETVEIQPMSWTVRYVVYLDDVLAAVDGPPGAALVPAISFAPAGSRLSAVEHLTRSFQDVGCDGGATTFRCTRTFRLGGPDPAGQLAPAPADGLAIGIPMRTTTAGSCAAEDYVLGPALWDNGGATADAHLGLIGGGLPADPYAPVRVSWPGNSGQPSQPFASTPCQGDGAVCQDSFSWHGTVRLQTAS
jgi:hypothetical protein